MSDWRIETRRGREFIGAPHEPNARDEMFRPGDYGTLCMHHVYGQHVASDDTASGDQRVIARWPIESANQPHDTFASGIIEGLRRVESMMRELAERRGLSDERKPELLAECIAAEIADAPEAEEGDR